MSDVTEKRAREIRQFFEAFWSTGQTDHPAYQSPDNEVSDAEEEQFLAFGQGRSRLYACVLPGELVERCVERMDANLLDLEEHVQADHLIIDEYQDLNPMDIRFTDHLAESGMETWIAGDDDQSIYSFRFANPPGIQSFHERFEDCVDHTLHVSVRSAAGVMQAAQHLIRRNAIPDRIKRTIRSAFEDSDPRVDGVIHAWKFERSQIEARAIAQSCAALVDAGRKPSDLLILLSNRRVQWPDLESALESAGVAYAPPKEESWVDADPGRMILALLRTVTDHNDLVALRILLGLQDGVGPVTLVQIGDAALQSGQLYSKFVRDEDGASSLGGRAKHALTALQTILVEIDEWTAEDTLVDRREILSDLLTDAYGDGAAEDWEALLGPIPDDTTIRELRDFIWSDNLEQRASLLAEIYTRLDLEVPAPHVEDDRLRVMTMHGVKGLSGGVVFVPGLEQELLPGPYRESPAEIAEAARLLYVSLTRARSAVVVSLATKRRMYGLAQRHHPSDFAGHMQVQFEDRDGGLTAAEASEIVEASKEMF